MISPMPPSPLQYRTPVSRFRSTLAKSLAFSRKFNSRNLELYWYPSWNHTLLELIADIPNLIVAPQFPLWFVEEVEEEEEEDIEAPEDGEDLDEDEDMENNLEDDSQDTDSDYEPEDDLGARVPAVGSSDSDFFGESDVGNASFSSGTTIPQKNAHSRIVDYAIVRVAAVRHTKSPARYAGWRITEEHVPVLIEEKRYPSRSLAKAQLKSRMNSILEEAYLDLRIQAAHLFHKFPGTDSVIAIAASGPYWSYTTISRKCSIPEEEFLRIIKTGNYAQLKKSTKKLHWRGPFRLDTTQSNIRFQTIYNHLRDLPVMEPA